MKLILLLAFTASPAWAQTNYGFITFTNRTGHLVERAEVYKVDADRAYYHLTVGAGGGSVLLADLPDRLQSQLGYGLAPNVVSEARIRASQADTNGVELQIARGPVRFEPFWKPSEGQVACGTRYFSTVINEFDRTVSHWVYNLDGDIGTMAIRDFSPGKPEGDDYRFLVFSYSKLRPAAEFDADKPLEFMVDGARFSFDDNRNSVQKSKYDTGLRQYLRLYRCIVNEQFLRSLGSAQRASIRIHTRSSPLDYDFNSVELRRFHLFAQNFLPDRSVNLK